MPAYLPTFRPKLLAIALLLLVAEASAQQTALPTRGRRFWTTFMQNGFGAQTLRIHIASTTATTGTVSLPLLSWSQPFSVAANSVAIIDLPNSAEMTGTETVQSKGVLVQAQDSVNVFMASFQNYTHDVSQVLPDFSLGTAYRVEAHHGLPNFNNLHKSEFAIVATEDGTEVSITPSANTAGGRPAGVPFTVSLNAGQTYQVQAANDQLDLTGSLIEATPQSGQCRPFVVIGGSMCSTAPGGCTACDHIFEQCPPLPAWGTRYYTVAAHGASSITYRILAHSDNTVVTIGGGAPFTLNAGERHTVSGASGAVCIEASKPVSVAQLMEGYSCAGNGDPSLLILSPADRVSRSARFHTSNSAQVNIHSISLVVPSTATGQVLIDGAPVSPALFQTYPGCNDRVHARVPVTPGSHRITCPAGFQASAFGIGYGESYAASVHDIRSTAMPQDSIVCGGGTITLNSPEPLAGAQWIAGSAPGTVIGTGNSITITPSSSETYTVSGLQPVSGCPRDFTYNVGMPLTIPTVLTANNQPSINTCQYEPVQLGLMPPPDPAWFDISWWPAPTLSDPSAANPVAAPTATTWYGVSVQSPTGCGGIVDSILVTVQPGAIIGLSATAQPAVVCQGNPTQLSSEVLRVVHSDGFDAPPGSMWAAIQGGAISTACGSVSGSALYFNGNGQRSAQTVAMNTTGGGYVRFRLKIGSGPAPCEDADPGDDVALEYSTNNGISWLPIATLNESAYPEFALVDEPIPPGAQTSGTMFRVRQLANQGAGHDNWAIDDFLVARWDNAFAAYSWSQPSTLSDPAIHNPVATPAASGWYVLSATDPTAGCVYKDSVFVQVEPAFSLEVTPSQTLCSLGGLQLQATPSSGSGITYAWTPDDGSLSDASSATPMATPAQTITYSVSATNSAGCTATGQTTITVGQLFGLSVSASAGTICQGQQVQLSATTSGGAGMAIDWSGPGLSGTGIANPTASPSATATYTCTATDPGSGCSLTESITITVNTGYTADAGADITLCSTIGHQLAVQHNVPNATYAWSPAANLNSAGIQAPTILADVTDTYTVTVSDPWGCSVSDQVTVARAFDGVPATLSANACASAPPVLTAPATGVSYAWSTGQQTASIVPGQSGPHTVTVTDANGCQAVTTFNVTLHPMPAVDLGPDLSICGSGAQTLSAGNPGSGYLWSTGATTQSITATASGTYAVTVTTPQGCSASDAIDVQFHAMPTDALSDVTACITAPPALNAGNPGSGYLWSTGATTQSITPAASGTYTVTVTTPQGCSATFDAAVTLLPEVAVDLGPDISLCQGQSAILDAGNAGASFLWSTGATSQQISVSASGDYSVTVSNGYCSASAALSVAVLPLPSSQLADAVRCAGESATLDAGDAGSAYLWSTGATTQSITVQTGGTYSVTITNASGCAAVFSATVEFIPPPAVDLGPDTVLCEGQALWLDAGNIGCTYAWSNGSASRRIAVTATGTYSVAVNNGACSRSDAIAVHFNPSPVRMATREFHACLDDEPRYVVIDAGNAGSRYRWSAP
ncbi:MAG: hypothetical protein ACK4L7_00410, partial [Flavobacteriales bacterium]